MNTFLMFLDAFASVTAVAAIVPLMLYMFFYDRGSIGFGKLGEPRKRKFGQGIWRKSPEGRTVMSQKFVLICLFTYITVLRNVGTFFGEEAVKAGVYIACLIVFSAMFTNLVKTLKENK